MKRVYVWRDGALVETTPKSRHNLYTVDAVQMDRRDACFGLDDIRQDHQRDSDRAEAEYYKAQQGE